MSISDKIKEVTSEKELKDTNNNKRIISNSIKLKGIKDIKNYDQLSLGSENSKNTMSKSQSIHHSPFLLSERSNNNQKENEKEDLSRSDDINTEKDAFNKSEDTFLNYYKLENFYMTVKRLVIPEENVNSENHGKNKEDEMLYVMEQIKQKYNLNKIQLKISSQDNFSINTKFNDKKIKILKKDNIDYINTDIKNDNKFEYNNNKINKEQSVNIYDSLNSIYNDLNLRNNLNKSVKIFPELISPKHMYDLFMHSIKQFEYEEKNYNKFINEEDLKTLISFTKKVHKYILGVISPHSKNKKS